MIHIAQINIHFFNPTRTGRGEGKGATRPVASNILPSENLVASLNRTGVL